MKYCPNCGSQLEDDAKFCTTCGANLVNEQPAAPQYNYQQPVNAQGSYPPPGAPNAYQQQAYNQNAYQQQAYNQNAYQGQAYNQNAWQEPVQNRNGYQEPAYTAQAGPQYNVNVYNSQAPAYRYPNPPVNPLPTTRALWKLILLSAVTFGIYAIVVMSKISSEINTVATRYDGRKTMHYCLVFFIFSWLTLGIVPFVWQIKLSSRMGHELARRNIPYSFGAGTFWGWAFFGSAILVGPFIYFHKFFKSMNLINANYNTYG